MRDFFAEAYPVRLHVMAMSQLLLATRTLLALVATLVRSPKMRQHTVFTLEGEPWLSRAGSPPEVLPNLLG